MDWANEELQYHGIAATTVFFYEYIMMLPDEVGSFGWPFVIIEPTAVSIDPIRVVIKQNLGYAGLSYVAEVI